jgi:hypothetical protein
MKDNEFWNPVLETMPREKLKKLQLKKFKEIFTWAYERSKFYRKLYQDAGIEPGDLKRFEDIRKVPKIEKSMLRSAQGNDPFPYGDMLTVLLGPGNRVPPNQRHDRPARLPGQYLAGLGTQHRNSCLRIVGAMLPPRRPCFRPVRLQYLYRILNLPLRQRENRL